MTIRENDGPQLQNLSRSHSRLGASVLKCSAAFVEWVAMLYATAEVMRDVNTTRIDGLTKEQIMAARARRSKER